jgi:hypothetical protein
LRTVMRRAGKALLPMQDAEENAVIVNALQRRADVVAQTSPRGLRATVAESMWTGRPVVAIRGGGSRTRSKTAARLPGRAARPRRLRRAGERPAARPARGRAHGRSRAQTRARPLPRPPPPRPVCRSARARPRRGLTGTQRTKVGRVEQGPSRRAVRERLDLGLTRSRRRPQTEQRERMHGTPQLRVRELLGC